ncbi:MAG TPA: DUF4388 domain-containing protein [Pyrinomonadaceae bacterium]|nr:DUF4388 domain-containing protein [Pyrinomonadaceae bacterium]
MENVERAQFVVLTGHTDRQPLPDLIRTLRVQRKSGRLQVEYRDGPGSFFFEDGQLVDAQLGTLRGVEAVYAALSLEGGPYNFNPLVRPPERNIDRQEQQFVRDLIESRSAEGLAEIRVARGESGESPEGAALPQRTLLQLPPAAELVAPLQERLTAVEEAIVSTSRRFSRERLIYTCVIGFLAGLSFITTLGVAFGPLRLGRTPGAQATPKPVVKPAAVDAQQAATPASTQERVGSAQSPNTNQNTNQNLEPERDQRQPPEPTTAALIATRKEGGVSVARGSYVVQVLVEVKNGRVTNARVWNPRPGAAVYEAVALRMARERRYPENFTGGERLKIMVKP